MSYAPTRPVDPLGWCLLLTLAYFSLTLVRLGIPTQPFFDEVHYLPAARALLELSEPLNREHPLLGKQIIALGIWLFGDNAFGWRIFSAMAGSVALLASMRALWLASCDRFATIAYGILLATGFHLFVHSRIAMLDIYMVCFCMIALWQFAGAIREPEKGRWRLALSGIALGLAMGSKWNALIFAAIPGTTFLIIRLQSRGLSDLFSKRGAPVPGVGIVEAAVWLGLVPLLVYAATFIPAFFYRIDPLSPGGLVAFQQTILDLQQSVKGAHPYQSNWQDWIVNRRAIWYLWEPIDGAQRGVMLIGNPLTMLLGLPALAWCAFAGTFKGRRDALAVTVLFIVTFGFWIVAAKPVQFYYHYFLPSCFLLAALALALSELRQRGNTWVCWLVLAGSAALFAFYFPVLSAAPVGDADAFTKWAWFDSWI
ncbi:phospholipid carrier-dependent glycosyltransferase [Altererythrobacter sp. ZODW24]|uniref:phospholipid carrier-dependent glycosyltransferase n=1 Tax=Altererythrobacter sp. ZODW24 TaxID=2185142 RepID=UPI000DF7E787|nr:phospholipid carrier-dependent glycosyltransferase [Altererythrobacter sp. ZODW24]